MPHTCTSPTNALPSPHAPTHPITHPPTYPQEGKLAASEELGDLFKGAGDWDTAQAIYQQSGASGKVRARGGVPHALPCLRAHAGMLANERARAALLPHSITTCTTPYPPHTLPHPPPHSHTHTHNTRTHTAPGAQVVEALAAKGDFEQLAAYTRTSGAAPDYMFLLQRLLMDNPEAAVNLATMVAKQVRVWVFNNNIC